MTTQPAVVQWTRLACRRETWLRNLDAIESARPALALRLRRTVPERAWFTTQVGGRTMLGVQSLHGIVATAGTVPVVAAISIAATLCPNAVYDKPTLVAGLDHAFLWERLYDVPTGEQPFTYPPPIYLLAGDLERLYAVLHIRDLTRLLADARVCLFAGRHAAEDFRDALFADPTLPLPTLSVTVEPGIWTDSLTAASIFRTVADARAQAAIPRAA